jgi:hypothetical protein
MKKKPNYDIIVIVNDDDIDEILEMCRKLMKKKSEELRKL